MNYLAHLFLSPKNDEVLFGNYIGDMLKGNDYSFLNAEIVKGIELHRFIDRKTDGSLFAREAVKLVKPKHGPYSAVYTDVVFDYFLYQNWSRYSTLNYNEFAENIYTRLSKLVSNYGAKLPHYAQGMIDSKWLSVYTTKDGLGRVYSRMKIRLSKPEYFNDVLDTLETHYEELNRIFIQLFDYLILEIREYFRINDFSPRSGMKG